MPDRTEKKPGPRMCPTCGRAWPGQGQGTDLESVAQAAQGLSQEVSAGVQGILSQMKALSSGLSSVKQHMKKLGEAEAGR